MIKALFQSPLQFAKQSQPPSKSTLLMIAALLTFLMVITRGNHFAAFEVLPSASTAVFFLAGMYLRNVKGFWYFYLLSIGLDLGSGYVRGDFGSCLTVSYPMLAFSYATLYLVGLIVRANWHNTAIHTAVIKISLALMIACSIAFIISNGSYYLLSGKFSPSWSEYFLRVEKYYLNYLTKPVFYVAFAVVIDFVLYKLTHMKWAKTENHYE